MSESNYGVQTQQLKHLTAKEYKALRELCFLSKNMFNVALYNIRQQFFADGKYLSYTKNYHICKANENYQLLNANAAQRVIKTVAGSFESFFALLRAKKTGSVTSKVRMPQYLEKDSFFPLAFMEFNVSGDSFSIPMSPAFKRLYGKVAIKLPTNLKDKTIKEIRLIPKYNARSFELQYVYELDVQKKPLNTNNALAIDLGIDNLATCVTNDGKAFIVDGKRLKWLNAKANKNNARLQSIKDKQKIKKTTLRQAILWDRRNRQVNDYLSKVARMIISYCESNDIGTIVLGYNKNIQKEINIGKANNQNFVNIPVGQLKDKLAYLCERHGIVFIEQEESYTSQADFLAGDIIPVYDNKKKTAYHFSGKRIKRGLYQSATGVLINADVNGALNILKKSKSAIITLKHRDYLSPLRLKVS